MFFTKLNNKFRISITHGKKTYHLNLCGATTFKCRYICRVRKKVLVFKTLIQLKTTYDKTSAFRMNVKLDLNSFFFAQESRSFLYIVDPCTKSGRL